MKIAGFLFIFCAILIMTKAHIPFKLTEAIESDKVLIFIGAGVSKLVGLPLWKEVVVKTLEDKAIDKGPAYLEALNTDILSPLEVLDKIEKKNRVEVYKCFESQTSKVSKHPIYNQITAISRRIVTTNYDQLIEHNTGIEVISINSPYSLQKIDSLSEFILKIHGSCNEIDNAVIFTSNYEELYRSPESLAKFQFEKLISSYTCLFVGFSLSDNYVADLFRQLHVLYNKLGKPHYVISTDEMNFDFVETIKIDSYSELPETLSLLQQIKASTLEAIQLHSSLEIGPTNVNEQLNSAAYFVDGTRVQSGNDTPPVIEHWSGRAEELSAISLPNKVCFITGIGGQGKSALASKLLSTADRHSYSFIDWRDFKEEGLNFQSKLFQLIELVSHGALRTADLVGFDNDYLIELFFEKLGSQKGIFVFDNIDRFIDLQKFVPADEMGTFFQKALDFPHKAKFVFTCRPFIHFARIGFYQVQLVGLNLDDTKELIKKYHPNIGPIELQDLGRRLHNATKGHPLWMGLILAQSRTDVTQINDLLNRISNHQNSVSEIDISRIVSETILKSAWAALKERERVILRTLSISTIAEKEEDLAVIVKDKVKFNQFSKALKSLKSLNLIVAKERSGYIELHPLVREFIKGNYAKEQQENYVSLYVSYLDGFIVLLKHKLGKVLGSEDLDLIIKKVEILINGDKLQEAINELLETKDSFQISGYSEDFLRLCDLVLKNLLCSSKKLSKLHDFQKFIDIFFTRAADFGCYDLFDLRMSEFQSLFRSADSNMILAKSAICHKEWCKGNYMESIREGKSASDLIDILGEKDMYSGKHRYNLALRDSLQKESVAMALKFFLDGSSIDELFKDEDSELSSTYGNVGRCLIYMEKFELGAIFTLKSYLALAKNTNDFFHFHNLGYAALWIGEMLEKKQRKHDCLYFYLYARNIWKGDRPTESNKIELKISRLADSTSLESIRNLESWQISKFCDNFVREEYTSLTSKNLREVVPTFT